MKTNYEVNQSPKFRILTDDQVYELHLATLELLEETGVQVENKEALEMLHGAGAHVCKNNLVKIPSYLIEQALSTAPKRITLADRTGKRCMFLEDHKVYYGTNTDCPNIIDISTGKRRQFLREDGKNAAIVSDYLPNIDFVLTAGQYADVPADIGFEICFKEILLNTIKPVIVCTTTEKAITNIIEMAEVVAGSSENLATNPFIIHYAEPISPLRHCDEGVRRVFMCADKGIPMVYTSMPAGGSTSPVTPAATLLVGNAEALSGILIAQLRKKGAPCIYGTIPSMFDMSSTVFSYGAPELNLCVAALADLGHYYRLPIYGTAGCSDSKLCDQQAAIESALTVYTAALSGANLVHDTGLLESAITLSLEMMVMTDEIIGRVKKIMGGFEINKETLALDVINRVGPGGHFLADEHTLNHFRETWYPTVSDRRRFENWVAEGSLSMGDRLNKKVKEIIKTHRCEPLSEDVVKELAKLEKSWR